MNLKTLMMVSVATLFLSACGHFGHHGHHGHHGSASCGCQMGESKNDCKDGECGMKKQKCADCEKSEVKSSK
jgi:hypothetical protein